MAAGRNNFLLQKINKNHSRNTWFIPETERWPWFDEGLNEKLGKNYDDHDDYGNDDDDNDDIDNDDDDFNNNDNNNNNDDNDDDSSVSASRPNTASA